MYSLIVAGKGWNPNRDSFPRSRVFEYTSDALKGRFKPEGSLDLSAIAKLPTLFASETNAAGGAPAHIGTINRIRKSGTNYELEYTYESDLPAIPNAKLIQLQAQLDIEDYELWRTHWAVKEVDLFYVLLRSSFARPPSKVFEFDQEPLDENLISVMMPFTAAFDEVYQALNDAVSTVGKRCQRADNMWRHDAVIQDIVSLICTSSVVICDLSGKNANVFYEAGIAHTLGKPVILIAQSEDDVPFNLRHLRFVHYLNNAAGRKTLAENVRKRIQMLSPL